RPARFPTFFNPTRAFRVAGIIPERRTSSRQGTPECAVVRSICARPADPLHGVDSEPNGAGVGGRQYGGTALAPAADHGFLAAVAFASPRHDSPTCTDRIREFARRGA